MRPNLSIFRALLEILRTGKVTSLWLGKRASLILTISPAITYGFYEHQRTQYLHCGGRDHKSSAFWMDAITEALATVVTYPLILAKLRMQGEKGGEVKEPTYEEFMDVCLVKVVESDGIVGWFRENSECGDFQLMFLLNQGFQHS
ncbi:hypothetical protein BJ742DRAFT_674247 [Cladochytrium replicatum]|nr:hypothetical protein BJ742DRAFT_674247 [Cladochytrium replicatum]